MEKMNEHKDIELEDKDNKDIELELVEDKDIELEDKDNKDIELEDKDNKDIELEDKDNKDIELEDKDNKDIELEDKDNKPKDILPDGFLDFSSDSSSSSSDSESANSSSESSDDDENHDDDETPKESNENKKKTFYIPRTAGEILPEELPPVENLSISIDSETKLDVFGEVQNIVGILVLIKSTMDLEKYSPVDEDTVLFYEDRKPFGKVFETLGQVKAPFYTVRFNSVAEIAEKGITSGTKLLFAPELPDLTNFVFVSKLKQIKGSDASWKDDNEPPQQFLDYSDDEEERKAKRERKLKKPGKKYDKRSKNTQEGTGMMPKTQMQRSNEFTHQRNPWSNNSRPIFPSPSPAGNMSLNGSWMSHNVQPPAWRAQTPSFERAPGPAWRAQPPAFERVPGPAWRAQPPAFERVPGPAWRAQPPAFDRVPGPAFERAPGPAFERAPGPAWRAQTSAFERPRPAFAGAPNFSGPGQYYRPQSPQYGCPPSSGGAGFVPHPRAAPMNSQWRQNGPWEQPVDHHFSRPPFSGNPY